MARIRRVEICNFRGISRLDWHPESGINCLIGPGDSGKSTIIDAIDLCLGARRNLSISDADFHFLNVENSISISVTIGELSDDLKAMDVYGVYLRGYKEVVCAIEEEPSVDSETVLTINLTVHSDLEPVWSLVSARAAAQGQSRALAWKDRVKLAPTRLGALAEHNLGWQRGSVLNLLSDERPDVSVALMRAARDARVQFGHQAERQLSSTLEVVAEAATDLGIPYGAKMKAMLDSHSVSFSGGTISLHDESGIPMRGLGVGSTRLLIAELQRKAAKESTIILIDELEHGLEPHRVSRLLGSIGAKEAEPPLQALITTHSPSAIRELNTFQLFVVRKCGGCHVVQSVPTSGDIQGTIRLYPEALLAPTVVVCEGASEVGFLRGIDQYRWTERKPSLAAMGIALVDGNGTDQVFKRGLVFQGLGYRVAVLRDDDVQPTPALEQEFANQSGRVTAWRTGHTLEDELFLSLSNDAVLQLVECAVELHGEELIDANIKSASGGELSLSACRSSLTQSVRVVLGKASRPKKAGWFKSVTWMEHVAREIVAPDLSKCDQDFSKAVFDLFEWMENGA